MSCGYTAPVYCNGAYVCEKCEGFCQSTALSHSYGQVVANALGPANAPSIGADELIIKKFPISVCEALANYITEASAKGSTENSGAAVVMTVDPSKPHFITAVLMNSFSDGIKTLGGGTPHVSVDQLITADYFQTLMTEINTAKFKMGSCDRCNTGCDIACKNCVTCNSCQNSSCSDCDI